MEAIFTAYHTINGTFADVGKYPYSKGCRQVVYKDVEIDTFFKEQEVDTENQDGIDYPVYIKEKNVTHIVFIISQPEIDFWQSLKYVNNVSVRFADKTEHFLSNPNVEVTDSGVLGLYEAKIELITEDSFNIITGNEL